MGDLRGGGGLDHRLRIGKADIFGSQNAKPPRDEKRIGAALNHPRQPVKCRVHVRVAQRFDQRGCQVVMFFAAFVVSELRAAQGFDQRLARDQASAIFIRWRRFDGRFERGQRDARISAGRMRELCNQLIGNFGMQARESVFFISQSPPQDRLHFIITEWV